MTALRFLLRPAVSHSSPSAPWLADSSASAPGALLMRALSLHRASKTVYSALNEGWTILKQGNLQLKQGLSDDADRTHASSTQARGSCRVLRDRMSPEQLLVGAV